MLEIEEDKRQAEKIKNNLTTLRNKFPYDQEDKRSNLKRELQQAGVSGYRREIRLTAFESDMQEANALLDRKTERADTNEKAICEALQNLQNWKRKLDEIVSTSSSSLQIYSTPTVSRLYYVLGEFIDRWRILGSHFKISEAKLNVIQKNHPDKSYRCMIEMLHILVRNSTACTWDTVEKVLKDMNETDLAGTIQHYTRELLRIELEQRNHNAQCKRLVPLKHQCGGSSNYDSKKTHFPSSTIPL